MHHQKKINLIPRPEYLLEKDGEFHLNEQTAVLVSDGFCGAAELLLERLRRVTGFPLPLRAAGESSVAERNVIAMIFDVAIQESEAYELEVSPERVTLRASDDAGAFYATQTFLQLLPACIYGPDLRTKVEWKLPAAKIADAPRFGWRGMMLDSSRYFQPIEYVRKFIDLISQHKINIFHWHLTDDQGWRIEIKRYPRLTEVGAYRSETMRGHQHHTLPGDDDTPHGGFYTQEEIRELVAYAAARNVAILPEIEMPGHAHAAVAAYPELGLHETPQEVSGKWGIHDTLYNVKPSTLEFLKNVLDEVMDLFPFSYVHIGGDEARKTQWENDDYTRQRMKALGLKNEEELQAWFIGEIAVHVEARGRKLIGWDEILEGGKLPDGTRIMSWRSKEGAILAAKQGLEAIMNDSRTLYFGSSFTSQVDATPLTIGGHTPLEKVYAFEPIPEELTTGERAAIIGVQGHLWTEYLPTLERLEYMGFPRICAFAEVAWRKGEHASFGDFLGRLKEHLYRLDCQEVRYAPPFDEFLQHLSPRECL